MSMLHHPPEDLLLSYAAGTLDEAYGVMIATHLSLCPACRSSVFQAEAIGGELMEQLTPAPVDPAMLNAVMGRLDDVIVHEQPAKAAVIPANLVRFPKPLRDYIAGDLSTKDWKWQGPGVHYASLAVDASGNKMGLMRIAAGTRVPHHGHTGEELTMVLEGGYHDSLGRYGRGDVEFADGDIKHQPVADDDGECLCLIVTRGKMKPTGFIAKLVAPLLSF